MISQRMSNLLCLALMSAGGVGCHALPQTDSTVTSGQGDGSVLVAPIRPEANPADMGGLTDMAVVDATKPNDAFIDARPLSEPMQGGKRMVEMPLPRDAAVSVDQIDATLSADMTLDAASLDAGLIDARGDMSALVTADMGAIRVEHLRDSGPDLTAPDMVVMDASLEAPQGTCPPERGVERCRFGWTTRQLQEQETLRVQLIQRIREGEPMPQRAGQQLVFGFDCEGLFAPQTPEAALELLDMDGLRLYAIDDVLNGRRYTWHKFYMGDTEVGYIFVRDTLQLVGIVGDGDINRCQVSQ